MKTYIKPNSIHPKFKIRNSLIAEPPYSSSSSPDSSFGPARALFGRVCSMSWGAPFAGRVVLGSAWALFGSAFLVLGVCCVCVSLV